MEGKINEKINEILQSIQARVKKPVWYNYEAGKHNFGFVNRDGRLESLGIMEESIFNESIIDNLVYAMKRRK